MGNLSRLSNVPDPDKARQRYETRNNPPEYVSYEEEDFDFDDGGGSSMELEDFDSLFSDSESSSFPDPSGISGASDTFSSQMGSSFGNPSSLGASQYPMGQPIGQQTYPNFSQQAFPGQQQQQQQGAAKEALKEMSYTFMTKAGAETGGFFSTLTSTISTFRSIELSKMGKYMMNFSYIMAGIGAFMLLMGIVPLHRGGYAVGTLLGAALTWVIGGGIVIFMAPRVSKAVQVQVEEEMPVPSFDDLANNSIFDEPEESEEEDWNSETFNDDSTFLEENSEEESSFDDDDWGEDIWETPAPESAVITTPTEEAKSVEEALEGIKDHPQGMFTRQFLFEKFNEVLAYSTPNYNVWEVTPEGSTEFINLEDQIQSSSVRVGIKEDELPRLLSVKSNSFLIRLEITRPNSMTGKEQKLADELASVYSLDKDTGIRESGIYATAESASNICFISIYTGPIKTPITLKDIYQDPKARDFVLDASNKMPVVMGVSASGQAVFTDFSKINSILVAGMADSGKSWAVAGIVGQIAAYSSPSDVNFIIFDAKKGFSSFEHFDVPHVIGKYFGNVRVIIDKLKWVVTTEQERRGKLLSDAGVNKIQDYNQLNPQNKIPFLYVVIDEMMALSGMMDKDERKEFHSYITNLVSKLRAVGIRGIFIPHRVVDEVIPKNAYELVECFVSARANPEELKKMPNYVAKKFPYILSQPGDLAAKISGINANEPMYVRGLGLMTSDIEINQVYGFLGGLWRHLEPGIGGVAQPSQVADYSNLQVGEITSPKAAFTPPQRSATTAQPQFTRSVGGKRVVSPERNKKPIGRRPSARKAQRSLDQTEVSEILNNSSDELDIFDS